MGKYNFDEIINRYHTNSLNTDGFREYIFKAGPEMKFKFKDEDFVRMWVADMEFGVPEVILSDIKERLNKKILGYTSLYDNSYYDAFFKWCKLRYDWIPKKEEIVFSPGIIPALYQLIENILVKGEKVLFLTPSYGFFKNACDYNNIEYIQSDLVINNGNFEINFEDLEKKSERPEVKLFIFCNPHNPTGHLWTEEELNKIAKIIEKNKLWIISDEIHCDLLRVGLKHIPMAKIMPNYSKLITCMSASKSFNIAGLQFSNIIIRDKEQRYLFKKRDKLVGFINPLSLVGHQAAYEKGEDWLFEMQKYLDNNFRYLKDFLNNNYPSINYQIPKATYLAWINLNNVIPEKYLDNLTKYFADNGLLLEGGNSLFVGNAKGFIRLNLAMPLLMIQKGLERLAKTINELNS